MSWSLADSTLVLAVYHYIKPCCPKPWVEINEEVVKRNEPMTFSQFETHMFQFCEFAGIFFAKSTHIDDYTKNTQIGCLAPTPHSGDSHAFPDHETPVSLNIFSTFLFFLIVTVISPPICNN